MVPIHGHNGYGSILLVEYDWTPPHCGGCTGACSWRRRHSTLRSANLAEGIASVDYIKGIFPHWSAATVEQLLDLGEHERAGTVVLLYTCFVLASQLWQSCWKLRISKRTSWSPDAGSLESDLTCCMAVARHPISVTCTEDFSDDHTARVWVFSWNSATHSELSSTSRASNHASRWLWIVFGHGKSGPGHRSPLLSLSKGCRPVVSSSGWCAAGAGGSWPCPKTQSICLVSSRLTRDNVASAGWRSRENRRR